MLGTREPAIYGKQSLADIEVLAKEEASSLGYKIDFRQSNHEGELVSWIQELGGSCAGLIINAGALTHTSVAIHDSLRGVDGPIYEVHLSNIFAREEFRHKSYISGLALGVICGLGSFGYICAIRALNEKLKSKG